MERCGIASTHVVLSGASSTNENTLISGGGIFHDLLTLVCDFRDNSAITINVRDASGGAIVLTVSPPSVGGTVVAHILGSIPQNNGDDDWTVQLTRVPSHGPVAITAIFKKTV